MVYSVSVQRIVLILFGAAFTAASCWASGALLLRRLRLPFDPLEQILFSFLCGAPCISSAVFILCITRAIYPAVILCTGAGVILWAALDRVRALPSKPLPATPMEWKLILFVIFASCFLVYFFNALAPEVSPDGAGYHLGNVVRDLHHHGFLWSYRSMYSAFPQGMEMLFLVAFAFGEHSSAALVHFIFFAALPVLILSYGRRSGTFRAAAFAAILVATSPLFGVVGTSAYNDVALVTGIFAVFYLLEVWDELKLSKLLLLVGLLCGFCFALKYTGGLALVFALLRCRGPDRRAHIRHWFAVLAPAALVALPWLLRNWIWLGNPLAPFFNRWFPNPYFSSSFERDYLVDLAQFANFHHWWEFPLEVTIFGGKIRGFLGPVFLLTPLAFLSLRYPQGRRLLAAGALVSVPIFFNADTRFLMPAVPFAALALGMAVANSPAVLPALALFQAFTCWPSVMPLYSASWSWRIREVPVRAALRLEPESTYIERHFSDYKLKVAIDHFVPKSQIIFSFRTRAEAYFDRTILVGYESAFGQEVQHALLNAAEHPELRPAAAASLKERGIGFLLVSPTDPAAGEFANHLNSWGMTSLDATDETSLYRIE